MRELGIKWEIDSNVVIDGRYYFEPGLVIHPVGGVSGGLGQLGQWREIAARMGVEIRYESRVRALLGNDRHIDGVVVSDPNEEYEIQSGSIILCAGGYQANAEMRARYLGANADLMKVRGSRHDTGEVLMMTLALGAKAAGHWQGAHATPIDSTYPDVEIGSKANRYGYPYGITVNSLGQRFFDEGEARHSYTYAKTGWAVLGQPGAVAYQIYDQKTIPLLGDRYESATPIEAKRSTSWPARSASSPRCSITRSKNSTTRSAKMSSSMRPNSTASALEGITPKKSNWASPIDKPPYWAFSITGGITFTFGGLQINASARC